MRFLWRLIFLFEIFMERGGYYIWVVFLIIYFGWVFDGVGDIIGLFVFVGI